MLGLRIFLILATAFFLSSCKRAGEEGVTRVSLTIPAASFVVEAKHEAMSMGTSWNASLVPANISEINCYVILVDAPNADSTQKTCVNKSGTTVINYTMMAGGISAGTTPQNIELEVPTGSKRSFSVVGLKASSANLAKACVDFQTVGIDKSLFSQPLIIGTQTKDIIGEKEEVIIETSLASAANVEACGSVLDITPAVPPVVVTGLAVTPAGPSNQTSPSVTGILSGTYPIAMTLHSTATCLDSVYTTSQSISSAASFSLAVAPAISGDGIKNIYVKAVDAANSTTCVGPVAYNFDSTGAALTITQASMTANSAPTFSGACETTGTSVTISGASSGSVTCSGGIWSFTAGAQSTDASYSYSFTQSDSALNATTISGAWIRDTVGPALTVSQASLTAATAPTFSGTCENGLNVMMTGSGTGSVMCSGGVWSQTVGNQASDGTYTYTFAQTDLAGNASSVVRTWTRDTTVPTIVIAGNSAATGASAPTFSGTCTTGLTITVAGADSSSTSCSGGTWTYTVGAKSDGNYAYTFSQTSGGGSTSTANATWSRDTVPPVATSFSAVQASPVSDPLLLINFQATDATQVAEYCIQMVTTAPPTLDSCWKPLPAPGPSPTVSSEPFLTSLIPNSNNYYLFLKDSDGNISSLTASGTGTLGVDKLNMSYSPMAPPVVLKIIAGNADAMTGSTAELTVGGGSSLYVRWKILTAVSANGISIDYTTNDMTWVNLATNLMNAANSCTVNGPGSVDDDATGCAVLTAPTSSYFRIRIRANNNGFIGGAYSESLNVNSYRELAGRPGNGVDFDASQLKVGTIAHNGFQSDNDALVVDSAGNMYVRDEKLGIIRIQSANRKASIYIPMTGTSSGDGGPAISATLRHPFKIALDAQDNLYIYDFNVIRRVAKNTGIIQTVIGGGANATLTTKPATSLQLNFGAYQMTDSYVQAMPFIVLGNGDVIFEDQYRYAYGASTQSYFWYYDHNTGDVIPKPLSGTGYTANGGEMISNCNAYRLAAQYDPKTYSITGYVGVLSSSNGFCGTTDAVRLTNNYASFGTHPPTMPDGSYGNLITGLDGKIYAYEGTAGRIYRYNWVGNAWTVIAGTGSLGSCNDGTAATSCAMSPTNVTVDRMGRVFFVEGGRIRTIENGSIRTIYGLPSDFGDGGFGMLAQFGKLMDIGFWDNGTIRGIVAYDASNKSFREFSLNNFQISKIAGNDTTNVPTLGAPALSNGLGMINWEKTFAVDPSNGDVYWKTFMGGGQLIRLDRGTGNWVSVVGNGGFDYFSSGEGMTGSNIAFNSGYHQPILFAGGYLYGHISNSSHQNVAIKSYYQSSSYMQTNVVSLSGANSSTCASAATSCGTYFPANGSLRVSFSPNLGKLMFALSGTAAIKYETSGSIFTFTTTSQGIGAFAYRYYSGQDYIYYCSSSGTMIKRNVSLANEAAITLPAGVQCTGSKVQINAYDNTVIFITVKNGNYGIASAPL